MTEFTEVVIVGGGTTGLSAAMFLARAGVSCVLLERQDTTPAAVRNRGLNHRTMELYSAAGLEADLRKAGFDPVANGDMMRVESLVGRELGSFPSPCQYGPGHLSPLTPLACDEHRLEGLVHRYAERLGARMWFGAELIGFAQDADGVTATVRNSGSVVEHSVRASYLVAADGEHSMVRRELGIATHGPGVLQHMIGIAFRADLGPALRGRRFAGCLVRAVGGMLLPAQEANHWFLSVGYRPDRGQRPEKFTPTRCVELVRAAAGLTELEVEVQRALAIEICAQVADRFAEHRAFLVGGAAQVAPPATGLSGNAHIQGAQNLAWKLAAVLGGTAGAALLDTHDAERRPVADLIMAGGLGGPGADQVDQGPDPFTMALGYRYHSAAVLAEAGDDQLPFEDPRHPSGRPGTRAAHLVVEHARRRLSTHDLFGTGFVLLAGAQGGAWGAAAAQVADRLELTIDAYRVGTDLLDVDGRWPKAYGVSEDGAVLIRPDGFLGWRERAAVAEPTGRLLDAVTRLCSLA